MITVIKSPTADTRTCDWSKVTKQQLLNSSQSHIQDVMNGMEFFIGMIQMAEKLHDADKLTDIDGFHRDFQTGFKHTKWWDHHRVISRHHLLQDDGIPTDVNLVDVLEMIVDCVMAGMARAGSVYPLEIKPEVLQRAFHNTVLQLKQQIRVIQPEPPKEEA